MTQATVEYLNKHLNPKTAMALLKYINFRKQFKTAIKYCSSFAITLDLSLTDATSRMRVNT